jgi:hypothetical protein
MFAQHPAARALSGMGAFKKPTAAAAPAKSEPQKVEPVLDAAAIAAKREEAVFDAANAFLDSATRMDVASALQQWAETAGDDLGEGETMADRLFALMVGIADDNKDGDLTDDEVAIVTTALENAFEYLAGKGVAEDDALKVLEDGDDEAAVRVAEFLRGALPEGEDGEMADVDNFAFDSESSSDLFDCVLDAVYKKKVVVRGGKKMRINKRVSGRVVLSAAQKVAIRKARRRAHSSAAKVHRAKSMKMRRRAGL